MRKVISLLLALVMTAAVFAVAAFAIMGDVNGDGSINNKDVVALFKYASGNEDAVKDKTACDYNGDGTVNNKDVVALFKAVSSGNVEAEQFEEAILYPFNASAHNYGQATIERILRIFLVTGREGKYISPGESFQICVLAEPTDIAISAKDVTFNILQGSEYAEISDDGVFTAKSEGTVKVQTVLKANNMAINTYFTIAAVSKSNKWEGSGTFRDPYLIKTTDDFLNLIKLSTQQNAFSTKDWWFKQTADLDFSGIKYNTPEQFMCNYDGDGHKIKNVTVDPSNENAGGF